MTNNTMNLEAIADAILNNNFDFNGYSLEQKAELLNAAEYMAETRRIDREYTEDGDASVKEHAAKKEEAAKIAATQTRGEYKGGTTILADSAFVPGSEDDDDIIIDPSSDDDNIIIAAGHKGDPEDGMHIVTFTQYPNKLAGKNGNSDFRIFCLRDVKERNEWTSLVSEEDVVKRLTEISFNNKGMLSGMNKKKAFENLLVNPVTCWTVKNQRGKVVTYFDEESFNRYYRWISSQKEKAEETYKKIQEQKRRETKAPWED